MRNDNLPGQLQFNSRGDVRDKVQTAIDRLQMFEPEEGYYVAFSGGKDSQCVYHLCKIAGVKFDAHYNVTSVDPPELIYFIRKNYPDVIWEFPSYNGRIATMWNLIPQKMMPPTRIVRYCCEILKESDGKGRVTVTGVRWAESARRANNQGLSVIAGRPKQTQKLAESLGANYKISKSGTLVLNDDNDASRRMVENCYRTQKTILNPIVDWSEDDVWAFLDENQIEHCKLYDQGYRRLGCIGCPMNVNAAKELEAYPKYKANYIRAFDRMLAANKSKGKEYRIKFNNGADVMEWWLQKSDDEEGELG